MKKIMVVDTQGPEGISDRYRDSLPDCVTIRGAEPETVQGDWCHPHGLMCGHLAAVIQNEPTELLFVRVFDGQAKMITGAMEWLLGMVGVEKPDYITRSWGQWDQDTASGAGMAQAAWQEWAGIYSSLLNEYGIVDFAAAGNSDTNDPDADIGYPQAMLPESNVIGSCRRDGVPSEFSGDGPNLQCLAWAEKIYLNNNGHFELGSGTSFAAPKMAGLCALHSLSNHDWRNYVMQNATRPKGYEEASHPKFGVGCMEDEYQKALQAQPLKLQPPKARTAGALCAAERWQDFHLLI